MFGRDFGLVVGMVGNRVAQLKDKEYHSVLSTVHRQMSFLDTVTVAGNTSSSSFDPADLTRGKVTVYLVLPPDHQTAQAGLLRLWVETLLRAVVKNGLQEQRLVRFVLDEAATLQRLDVLKDAVSVYRGYGVRLLFIYQSLGQLRGCWKEGVDQTLLSYCSQIFFAVNDPQTADYVSGRLGDFTEVAASGGTGESWSRQLGKGGGQETGSYTRSANDNWGLVARRLLQASEVMQLPPRIVIAFVAGHRPLWATSVRYYDGFRDPPEPGVRRCLTEAVVLFLLSSLCVLAVSAIRIPPVTPGVTRPRVVAPTPTMPDLDSWDRRLVNETDDSRPVYHTPDDDPAPPPREPPEDRP